MDTTSIRVQAARSPGRPLVVALGGTVAALMTAAAAAGLLVPDLYRDNAMVAAGWRGTDLVTLGVGVPLLALAARAAVRGSRRGEMTLLGMLLYAFYNYAFYLFGAAFNALFLVYVAIMVAAGAGLLVGLRSVDAARAAAGFAPRAPTGGVAAVILGVSALLGAFWVATSVAFFFTGEPPAMVAATDHPTNVTGALDLALVVAIGVVAGLGLRRRRPWGYVLALAWLIKGAVYMAALSSASVAAYLAGAAPDLWQLALWVPIGAGCAAATAALLRGYGASPGPSPLGAGPRRRAVGARS